MSLLSTQAAHREYANRPADESYPSLAAMVDAATHDKNICGEKTYNLKDLNAVAIAPSTDDTVRDQDTAHRWTMEQGGTIMLESHKGRARFTPWSFAQLTRTIGAHTGYLCTLPPAIAADAINFGLHEASAVGTTANLLVRLANGDPTPTIRAATSETYGRVWDADLYRAIDQQIAHHGSSSGGEWELPPTWEGPRKGAYRGDRDSFLVLTNGGSIVTDPTLASAPTPSAGPGKARTFGEQSAMYRGILVRNSEVGASAITIETILYRYICGNHMLWGAIADRQFRRRHVGSSTLRDTIREIGTIAYRWTNRAASQDEAIIRGLIDHELAHTKEAVIDELRKMNATKEQAEAAYDLCERNESVSPRSFWGAAQGMTRLSQQTEYNDDRYQLDKLAGLIMQRGAKLVAA